MTVTQSGFIAGLLDPIAATPAGLVNPDNTAAAKRFDIYRNNVAVGLTDALVAAFPVIHKLVGDDFFRAMAGVFLRKHPPTSPLMMFYGLPMPQFLRRFAPAQSLPYLPDIALLELAMRRAYHAADATALDPQALSTCAPAALLGARLGFAPSVQVLISKYPIHGIYRANTTIDAPKPLMKPEAVLITRPAYDPKIHLISIANAAAATALLAGDTLGQTLTDENVDLSALLALLLGQSAVTKLY